MAIALTPSTSAQPHPPLRLASIPRHVAVIMDGNGRWARERGKPRLFGHRAGTENVRRVIERFADYGVEYLTLFAFSTENWDRPSFEVRGLMALLSRFLKRETRNLHEEGIQLVHLGDLSPLKPRLQQEIQDAIDLTKNNTRMTLAIAFNYGGRAEIIGAVRRMIADGLTPDAVTEDVFTSYLSTSTLPDPDLVIRTAGEMRLSNFLLWQTAYAEFCFTPVYWPDFDIQHIDDALLAYSRRQRRFGGLVAGEPTGYPDSETAGVKLNGASTNGHTPTGTNGHHT